jgi:hypothetical protein
VRVIACQIAPPLPGILIAGDPRHRGRLRAAHRVSSCCAYEGYRRHSAQRTIPCPESVVQAHDNNSRYMMS